MSCVAEPDAEVCLEMINFVLLYWLEESKTILGVRNLVEWLDELISPAFVFPALPLGFHFLDVSRVQEQYFGKLDCWSACIDFASKTVFYKLGYAAGMVDVGVSEKDCLDFGGVEAPGAAI